MSELFKLVEATLPGAADFLKRNAPLTLSELSRKLNLKGKRPSEILIKSCARQARLHYGSDAALAITELLSSGGPVLSANHHGLDSHPEMVQGRFIFALDGLFEAATEPIIVLACSTIPLSNPTLPGAIMVGRRTASGRHPAVRLFPRSLDHLMVSRAPNVSGPMAKEFIKRIKNSDFLKPLEKQAAISLAEGSMLSSKFLSRESFLSQAALLNSEIWKSLFTSSPRPLIELELEKLTIDCLASDLALSDSPLARALTEPDIVKSLLPALAGVRGAWSASLLGQLAPPNAPMWRSTGTVFFWGVKNGRFFPMRIELVKNSIYLSGAGFNIPLAPEPLVTALSEGHLAPNLFVDYLVLAVHGLTAHGGVFMIDYLPALLEPAAHILEIKLETAPPLLAAGLLPLSAPDEPLSPLGLLEWLSFGPRPPELARLLGDTTIESLTPFSLGEWYQEEFPTSRRASSWRGPVAPPPLTLSSNKT